MKKKNISTFPYFLKENSYIHSKENTIFYYNSLLNKTYILKSNVNKTGVYRWINIINNKCYIGSSINLSKRLRDYYNKSYLDRKLLISNSRIFKAILKYGIQNFHLEILEYCNKEILIRKEQYYINTLQPEYNILKFAGSSLGYKHYPKTLLKFRNRKLSSEALINLKNSKKGIIPKSPLRKINHLLAISHITTIINILDNTTKVYNSMKEAAKSMGVTRQTLSKYIKNEKILKGTYIIRNQN